MEEIKTEKLKIDMESEDIHTFVEQVLTERLGDVGKKLHTARIRNDQVCLDIKMYLKHKIVQIKLLLIYLKTIKIQLCLVILTCKEPSL